MTVSCNNLNVWPRIARMAAVVMISSAAWGVVAHAQTPPYALFQYSTLTASGNTVTATRVPVVTGSGTTIYKNVVVQFEVDSSGNLTLAPGYPQVAPSLTPYIQGFKAGTYVGPSTVFSGKMFVTVNGPSVGPGGATEWSLAAASGANACTYPTSATWYAGPMANNPLAARIKAAGITTTGYAFGIVGRDVCSIDGGTFNTDALIGLSQIGSALTVYSFTRNSADSSTPVDQVTYELQ